MHSERIQEETNIKTNMKYKYIYVIDLSESMSNCSCGLYVCSTVCAAPWGLPVDPFSVPLPPPAGSSLQKSSTCSPRLTPTLSGGGGGGGGVNCCMLLLAGVTHPTVVWEDAAGAF